MKHLLACLLFICFGFGSVSGQTSRITATDDLFQNRIESIKSQVELIYNSEVKKYIEAYLANPESFRQILARSREYFPHIERSLKSRNLPVELKYVSAAASELNVFAQQANGSNGIWMMSYTVSKMYKGKVNSFVDERRDFRKSTQMAVMHLRDLFTIYHQWPIVIAAYGSSPMLINKAIRSSGNSLYFWDLYPVLPDGNKELYPRFVAMMYLFHFYKEHGIKPAVSNEPQQEKDSVRVTKWLSFQQIASTLDIPVDLIRVYNPVFKKDIIPFSAEGYLVYLPKNKMERFGELRDSVYNPSPSVLLEPTIIRQDSSDTSVRTAQTTPAFNKKRVSYTVKPGETLYQISRWFDVTPAEIKSWNKLRSNNLQSGKKLTIWVPASKTGYYSRINKMSRTQKKRLK